MPGTNGCLRLFVYQCQRHRYDETDNKKYGLALLQRQTNAVEKHIAEPYNVLVD